MACTIRWPSKTAKFGQPEVTIGIIPGDGGTQRLPRLVGKGRALQLILTRRHDRCPGGLSDRPGQRNRCQATTDFAGEAILNQIFANAPIGVKLAIEP